MGRGVSNRVPAKKTISFCASFPTKYNHLAGEMTTKDVTSQWNYGSNITDYNRDFMVMLITLPCSGLKVY